MSNTLHSSGDKDIENNSSDRDQEPQFDLDIDVRIEQLLGDTSEEALTYYRLRTDNWVTIEQSTQPPSCRLDLTQEEIKFTLEYFQQCVTRSQQMTNTYDDADAVNALLKEREKDIELAANIGLELLEINTELKEKVDALTEDLANSRQMVCQLRQELQLKENLIHSICSDNSDGEEKSSEVSCVSSQEIRQWHERIKLLDAENKQLRTQAEELHEQTDASEEKEKRLVKNCASKLASVNAKLDSLHKQMRRKSEECNNQKAHIEQLMNQIGELQKVIKQLTDENDELTERVHSATMLQSQLENRVTSLTDSYDECVQILESSQKEARRWRSLSQWRSSEDDLEDIYRESFSDAIASAAAAQHTYDSYAGGLELVSKFHLCHLLNRERLGSPDSMNVSRFTLADSGMHSDLESDEHCVVMRQPQKSRPVIESVKKCPPKLLLVKPFEGSALLKRWQQLATPSLANLLEDRPGIYGRVCSLKTVGKFDSQEVH